MAKRVEQVLHRLFAEEMVDAVHRRLGKRLVNRRVESHGGREASAERLLDDHAGVRRTTRTRQAGHDGLEQADGDREIEHRPLPISEGLAQAVEGCRVVVFPRDVLHTRGQPIEHAVVHTAVIGDALSNPRTQRFESQPGPGDADHGNVEMAVPLHRVQGRKNLLISQVARGSENNQAVRMWLRHHAGHLSPERSTYPPN